MLRTTKLSFFAVLSIASIALLFSFNNAFSKQRQAPLLEEGDDPVEVKYQTRKSNQQAIEATVTVTKGSNSTTFQTTNGEIVVPSFGPGLHDITITKTGYVSINGTFDAQGETMTLQYILQEE